MSDVKVQYIAPGAAATEESVREICELVAAILGTPGFVGKPTHIVLNALASAHWTAACLAGEAERTAEALVQMGGTYLAGLELARAAGSGVKPAVH